MASEIYGQYGKQNPLFLYQATVGYSVQAGVCADAEEQADLAEPDQCGVSRCGTLQ